MRQGEQADGIERMLRALRVMRALWFSGLVLVFVVPAVAIMVPPSPPLVMGGSQWFVYVTRGPVIVGCILLGWLLWVPVFFHWLLRHHDLDQRPRKALRVFSCIGAAVVALPWSALGGMVGLILAPAGVTVLSPLSRSGCAVVSVQTPGMRSGGGDIYLWAPGRMTLVDTGASWWINDAPGYDPIDDGMWSLSWEGEEAQLWIWGKTGSDEVSYTQPEPIVCPS